MGAAHGWFPLCQPLNACQPPTCHVLGLELLFPFNSPQLDVGDQVAGQQLSTNLTNSLIIEAAATSDVKSILESRAATHTQQEPATETIPPRNPTSTI